MPPTVLLIHIWNELYPPLLPLHRLTLTAIHFFYPAEGRRLSWSVNFTCMQFATTVNGVDSLALISGGGVQNT